MIDSSPAKHSSEILVARMNQNSFFHLCFRPMAKRLFREAGFRCSISVAITKRRQKLSKPNPSISEVCLSSRVAPDSGVLDVHDGLAAVFSAEPYILTDTVPRAHLLPRATTEIQQIYRSSCRVGQTKLPQLALADWTTARRIRLC